MDGLAGVLCRERRQLEVVLFKLVETGQLVGAGDARFLAWAAAEVERAVTRVRETDLERATRAVGASRTLGLPADRPTLRRIAGAAPAPFRAPFADHRHALLTLLGEIDASVRSLRAGAAHGLHVLRTAGDAPGRGERLVAASAAPSVIRLAGDGEQLTLVDLGDAASDADEALAVEAAAAGYEAVLAATAHLTLPALADFLR